jgi:hypothetical protein
MRQGDDPASRGRFAVSREQVFCAEDSMTRALVLAAALILSVNAAGRAADPQGYYTIQGVGQESCEIWIGERLANGPTAWYHQQWVLGYITAFNRWAYDGSNVAVNVGPDKLFEWLDEYCNRNPQQNLSLATEALVGQLWKVQH